MQLLWTAGNCPSPILVGPRVAPARGTMGSLRALLRDCELVNAILEKESFSMLINTGPLQVILAKGRGLSTHDIFFLD